MHLSKRKKRERINFWCYINRLFFLHYKSWDCLWCCSFPFFFFLLKMMLKLTWGFIVMQYKVNLAGHCCLMSVYIQGVIGKVPSTQNMCYKFEYENQPLHKFGASIVYWVRPYNFANNGLSHEILMMDCGVECGCCVRMGFSFMIVMQLIRQISL